MSKIIDASNHLATVLNVPTSEVNLSGGTIETTILNVIQWALGIAGAVMVLMLIAGGVMYITAGGDPGHMEKAKSTIKAAIIGLVIILISAIIVITINYAITGYGPWHFWF